MNKSIGLFGGTFDPVHFGHIAIAHSFLESSLIDELWVLLTPFPPHKEGSNHASYQHRKDMLELAFLNKKNIKILTIENELPKPSYSFNTIQYLKKLHPECTFFFCIGEDNLSIFNSWKNHKEILKEVKLLVANRPEANHSTVSKYILDNSIFVDHKPISVSSSKIKEHINHKDQLREFLPKNVLDFILSKSLYKNHI
ncbi:MAG: nicotinate (nicotinamide) nucleotide adenylyltransferase [Balneolaceae bacterium]